MGTALPLRTAPPPQDEWDPADCRALWLAALEMYVRDATAGYRGSQTAPAQGALRDVLGRREQLARLCLPLDLDIDATAEAILARLEI